MATQVQAAPPADDWEKDLDWLLNDKESQDDSATGGKGEQEKYYPETNESPPSPQLNDGEVSESQEQLGGEESVTDGGGEYDDDYEVEMTPEVMENTKLNQETDEDYDVQVRVHQANQELAESQAEQAAERKRKITFKPDLIDFEAPADDYSSDDSDDNQPLDNEMGITNSVGSLSLASSSDDDSPRLGSVGGGDMVEINGQRVRRNEKVLIERGGKFELVEVSELEGILPPLQHEPGVAASNSCTAVVVNGDNLTNGDHVTSSKPQRPKSAPVRSLQPRPPSTSTRPVSATTAWKNPKKERTFRYSAEMKEVMKKRMAARAEREREEERRRKVEEETARREANEAWRAWLDRKNALIREQKKAQKQREEEENKKNARNPDESKDAYMTWLRQKRNQMMSERIATQQMQMEEDEKWFIRDRRDCDKAFRTWLRRKNDEARRMREADALLRRQSRRMARQARKAQRLLEALREAQEMKYIEYYGYRF